MGPVVVALLLPFSKVQRPAPPFRPVNTHDPHYLPVEHIDRYSNEQGCARWITEPTKLEVGDLPHIEKWLAYLPDVERDIVELMIQGVSQGGIAGLLNMTQPAVSYRYARAKWRLRWHYERPPRPDDEQLRAEIAEAFPHLANEDLERVIRIITTAAETCHQSLTAKTVGVTQGRVRHYFVKACEKLGDTVAGRWIRHTKWNVLHDHGWWGAGRK